MILRAFSTNNCIACIVELKFTVLILYIYIILYVYIYIYIYIITLLSF